MHKLALYGLGNMGIKMAERLAANYPLWVADLNPEAVQQAQSFGAQAITEDTDLQQLELVFLCLPSPTASRSVLNAIAPRLKTGTVIVETSTVNPVDLRACADLVQPYGHILIDASIMAGVSQMAAGSASLLIGGDEATVQKYDPVFAAIAQRRIYFGASGTGAAAKVINNAVAHAVMVVVAEAGSMATAAGVDRQKLIELLSDPQMGLHRPLTHRYAERIAQGNYEGGMPLEAARKDSVLALELAQQLEVPLFAIQGSHSVYDMALRSGLGRQDYAALACLWEQWQRPTY